MAQLPGGYKSCNIWKTFQKLVEFGTPMTREHLQEGYKAFANDLIVLSNVADIEDEPLLCPGEALAAKD